jgi:hypothetical protein
LPLDAIAQEIIGVIEHGGLAKLKEYLEDYPKFAQAKILGLLWGLMDTESTLVVYFHSNFYKTGTASFSYL